MRTTRRPSWRVNVWYTVGSKERTHPVRPGSPTCSNTSCSAAVKHFHGRYVEAMERIGATDLNGTPTNDRTNYFETVPVSALDYTLWMESDRMGYMVNAHRPEDARLAARVVQNEKRQDENQPYSLPRN